MITIPFVRRRSHASGCRKLRDTVGSAQVRRSHKLRVELLESRELLAADLAITEFMASNGSSLTDGDGNTPDWIEIHNRGDQAATLAGWRLTDQADRRDKWEFPFVSLDAGSYLIVFASGEDRAVDSSRLRRDFHSTSDGTFLVDLPQGTYDVRLTLGDETRARDQVTIHLQDALVDTVMTAAGEYAVRTFTVEVSDRTGGQLALRLEDLGGETGRAAINALIIALRDGSEERRFDFGTADAPVEPSFTAVTDASFYSGAIGYGWQPGTVVSSQDRGVDLDELHTNFKLSAKGEYLGLIAPDGTTVSQFGLSGEDYPPQRSDVSYGITDQGARYFAVPTPGEANAAGQVGFVGATEASVDHGFFDAPFQVDLTTERAGATIRYTTDGSAPTENRGAVATGPLLIDGTTVLRAAAFKPGHVSGPVLTRTYIFLKDVIRQPDAPAGFPATWGSVTADYGLDPNVVDVAPYSQTIIGGLQAIPTMSLVLNNDDFFGSDGIYSNPLQRGRSWERPVPVEYFDPHRDGAFDINAGLRVHGGSARDPNITPQHSLRLHFRNEYGASQLDFPLFDDSVITRFDALVLNAQSSDNWTSANLQTGKVAQFMRDQWAQDMQREMGHVYVPGSYVHLYINGLYWGLYDIMERPDAAFAAAHFGGAEKDYDVIVDEVASHGDLNAWNDLLGRVRAGDVYYTLDGSDPRVAPMA